MLKCAAAFFRSRHSFFGMTMMTHALRTSLRAGVIRRRLAPSVSASVSASAASSTTTSTSRWFGSKGGNKAGKGGPKLRLGGNNNKPPSSGLILPGSPEFIAKARSPQEEGGTNAQQPTTLVRSDLTHHYQTVLLNQSEETRTEARRRADIAEPSFEPDESGVSTAVPEDMIDLPSLYDPAVHLPDKPNFETDLADDGTGSGQRIRYEVGTPLGEELIRLIGVRGPITVVEYMRLALRHPTLGYYTSAGRAKDDMEDIFDDDEDVDADKDDEDGWDNDWDQDEVKRDSSTTVDKASETGGTKVIGPRGDFTTAPEISQLFGESLAVWYLTQYKEMGYPSKIQLVEIGPGRGTLICDLLRSVLKGGSSAGGKDTVWERFVSALAEGGGVHLVEVARPLREEQRERLMELAKEEIGAYDFQFVQWSDDGEKEGDEVNDASTSPSLEKKCLQSDEDEGGKHICIQWHDLFGDVPKALSAGDDTGSNGDDSEPITTFVVGQEIIDALPVHSFQKTEQGWRERLVDVAVREEEPEHVKQTSSGTDSESNLSDEDKVAAAKKQFVAAQNISTQMRKGYSDAEADQGPSSAASGGVPFDRKPRLRFVLPPDTTPALRTLLNVDPQTGEMKGPNAKILDAAPPGTVMEVCPEGMMLVQDIASRIEECGGAALIIDYGKEGSGDTLRAFKRHKQAHPLSSPGGIDVTADVDFAALREAVNNGMDKMRQMKREAEAEAAEQSGAALTDAPVAFGPVTQGEFLMKMGAVDRVVALIEKDSTTDKQAEDLCNALERLTQPEHMGERYKVLAIARKRDGIFAPPAFA